MALTSVHPAPAPVHSEVAATGVLTKVHQRSLEPNAIGRCQHPDSFALAVSHPNLPAPDALEAALLRSHWGKALFGAAQRVRRTPLHWLQDQFFNGMMQDDNTKLRTIALFDAITAVPPEEFPAYLHQFFPPDQITVTGFLGMVLRLGTARWMPRRLVQWGLERMLRQMGKRFLAGSNATEALHTARQLHTHGVHVTLDVVTENVLSHEEVSRYNARVTELMLAWERVEVGPPLTPGGVPVRHVSVKFSAMTPRFDPLAEEHTRREIAAEFFVHCLAAKQMRDRGTPVLLNVDMETFTVRDMTYRIIWDVLGQPELAGWDDVGLVVQSYYPDADEVMLELLALCKERKVRPQIRIVKGAYHKYELILAAQQHWLVPVLLSPAGTDRMFQRVVTLGLLNRRHCRVAVGSHNLCDVVAVQEIRESLGIPTEEVEHQFLLGVGNHLARATVAHGIPTRLYSPFGSDREGLGYEVRRLDEVETTSAIGQTRVAGDWESYVAARRARWQDRATPLQPSGMFRNEPSPNFADRGLHLAMRVATAAAKDSAPTTVYPVIGQSSRVISVDPVRSTPIFTPSADQPIGQVFAATRAHIKIAVARAMAAQAVWAKLPQAARSHLLRVAAEKARKSQLQIAADIAREAGKPWPNALADVHEGIDFLEYYARQAATDVPWMRAENRVPLGVGVAIGPFNFPFAIPLGMVAGGLAHGNAMLLKPAEQTPLSALWAVSVLREALREADLPPAIVQLLPGAGETVGEQLVQHPDVDFITFTGSKAVADHIIQTAAAHPTRRGRAKIAVVETGGKNAAIVDTDADLDIAVPAILDGAFGAAGQRCSATSRVIVVASRAEDLVERLVQGGRTLRVGDALDPLTQVGPLIDAAAREKAERYVRRAKAAGTKLVLGERDFSLPALGHFMAPHIFCGVDPASPLAGDEIFGPVLAVITVADFHVAMQVANDSWSGLTAAYFGRNPTHIAYFLRHIEAGRAVVNQSQVGAAVGQQPFGGVKGSSEGPKAGGTRYPMFFTRPRHADTALPLAPPSSAPRDTDPLQLAALWRAQRQWTQQPAAVRLAVVERLVEGLDSSKAREAIVQGLADRLRTALTPAATITMPGTMQAEVFDQPLGVGLIWQEGEEKATTWAAALSALMMGNGVVLPRNPSTETMTDRFIGAGIPQDLILLTEQDPVRLLHHPDINFVVCHGPQADAVAGRFASNPPRPNAFRRAIGTRESPNDRDYPTRFANSHVIGVRTLRHGADLRIPLPPA